MCYQSSGLIVTLRATEAHSALRQLMNISSGYLHTIVAPHSTDDKRPNITPAAMMMMMNIPDNRFSGSVLLLHVLSDLLLTSLMIEEARSGIRAKLLLHGVTL